MSLHQLLFISTKIKSELLPADTSVLFWSQCFVGNRNVDWFFSVGLKISMIIYSRIFDDMASPDAYPGRFSGDRNFHHLSADKLDVTDVIINQLLWTC